MSTTSIPILSASVGKPAVLNLGISHRLTIERHIVTLFKECLAITEQLQEEHYEAMEKLYAALPPEYRDYVNLVDHHTDEKQDRIRRAILARGNDCRRAVLDELVQCDPTARATLPPSQP